MSIQLHYYPSTAAMVPHIVLEELGVPMSVCWSTARRTGTRSPLT